MKELYSMPPGKKQQDRTILYITLSLGILLFGIITTSIINNIKNSQSDIRAKASITAGLKFTAIIGEVSSETGTITVTNLMPYDNPTVNYGQWMVTTPAKYNFSDNPVGTAITLSVDTKTFLVDKHTLTATEIKRK